VLFLLQSALGLSCSWRPAAPTGPAEGAYSCRLRIENRDRPKLREK